MKKLAIVIVAMLILPFVASAKNPFGLRYRHKIFWRVDVTKDITYGRNYDYNGNLVDLKMDVYEPHGDRENKRALIIFIHGGGFISGDKAGRQWVYLCETFAKMGYVTASINYRLEAKNSINYGRAVTNAMYDAKAAVRYFRAHASEWRIDESKIALVGGSAGAITALHATYLREKEYEGDSGNAGYSSNVSACVDLWGGLYKNVSKIDENEPPVLIIHGKEDEVVPFSEAINISKRAQEVGVYCELHALEGEGHAPWHRINDFIPWIVDFLYDKMIGKKVIKPPYIIILILKLCLLREI